MCVCVCITVYCVCAQDVSEVLYSGKMESASQLHHQHAVIRYLCDPIRRVTLGQTGPRGVISTTLHTALLFLFKAWVIERE